MRRWQGLRKYHLQNRDANTRLLLFRIQFSFHLGAVAHLVPMMGWQGGTEGERDGGKGEIEGHIDSERG